MPKEVQEEIALVKDDLSLDKLEALVEKRAGSAKVDEEKKGGKAPPSIGVGGNDRKEPKGKHQIHASTKEIMTEVFAKDRHYQVAEGLGVSDDGKFGWGRTNNEAESTANFINLLEKIKAVPMGGVSDEVLTSRVLGKK